MLYSMSGPGTSSAIADALAGRVQRALQTLQGLPSAAFFSTQQACSELHHPGGAMEKWHVYCYLYFIWRTQEQMMERTRKVRKSAILEHLLDLERQIRAELAKATTERDSTMPGSGGRESRPVRDETMSREPDGMVATDIAQRYLH